MEDLLRGEFYLPLGHCQQVNEQYFKHSQK